MKEKIPTQLTVGELKEILNNLDESWDNKPVSCWINSQDPEPVYEGGSRIPIVYVDTLVEGSLDLNCEFPAKRPKIKKKEIKISQFKGRS